MLFFHLIISATFGVLSLGSTLPYSEEFGDPVHCSTLEERIPVCPTCSLDSGTESNGVSSLDLIINNVTEALIINNVTAPPNFVSLNTGVRGKRQRRK